MVREQGFSEMGLAGNILGPTVLSLLQLFTLVILVTEAIVGNM